MIIRLIFLGITSIFSINAYAVLGVGDVVNDPQANSQFMTMIAQAKEMYENAKKQLDGMVAIERTIKEANESYEILSNLDLGKAVKGLMPGKNSTKSFAALRGEVASIEGNASNTAGTVSGNMYRMGQLENLELIRSAAAGNVQQSSGKMNAATSAQITAQSTASLAALAASEEQRRTKEDVAREAGKKQEYNNLGDSKNVYEAMGK